MASPDQRGTGTGSSPRLLCVGDRALPLHLKRSRRARRLILRLAADGESVTVTLPMRASVCEAVTLAERSAGWIEARLRALPERVPFADGAVIPLLGEPLRIVRHPDPKAGLRAEADTLVVGARPHDLPQRVERWLKASARHECGARAAAKAARLGRRTGRISVRDPISRWASCAANGNLSFSWRLILAPEAVLDYVVAHEVAHLEVRSHCAAFWRVVASLTDDVDAARAWLRCHGASLHRYG